MRQRIGRDMVELDDFLVDDFDIGSIDVDLSDCIEKEEVQPAMLKRKRKDMLRRAFSEKTLTELFADGIDTDYTYHVLTGGKIDALSFLGLMLKHQKLKYLMFSTWCMKMDDVLQVKEWLENGTIGRVDAYVGEIFPASYKKEWSALCDIVRKSNGRVCVFRNHAKIFAGTGELFDFGIASSANIDTNPRTENTVISFGSDIFNFYKGYFDGIISFNRSFDKWERWQN